MDADCMNNGKVWIQEVPEIVSSSLGKPVSLWPVRSWCRQGKIKSVTVGGRRFVLRRSLIAFLEGEAS